MWREQQRNGGEKCYRQMKENGTKQYQECCRNHRGEDSKEFFSGKFLNIKMVSIPGEWQEEQIAGYDQEDVYSIESVREAGGVKVEQDNQDNGNASQSGNVIVEWFCWHVERGYLVQAACWKFVYEEELEKIWRNFIELQAFFAAQDAFHHMCPSDYRKGAPNNM